MRSNCTARLKYAAVSAPARGAAGCLFASVLLVASHAQAASIMFTGYNANPEITLELQALGHTVTTNHFPDAADLAGIDIMLMMRHVGNDDVKDFVNNGGYLITEWDASEWALDTAGLIAAEDNGYYVSGSVNFTDAATDDGLNTGLGSSYSDGGATSFYRRLSVTGSDVITYANNSSTGDPVIIGGLYGAGQVLVISYDWADGYTFGSGKPTNTLLVNALNLVIAFNTWDGSESGLWSAAGNWSDNAAPGAGELVRFGGVANTAVTHDNAADTAYSGVSFVSGAGSFNISGNRIGIVDAGAITNSSTNTQTFSAGILFAGDATIDAAAGDLGFNGGLTFNAAGSNLTVTGDHDTTITGVLSGDGGLIKNGAGNLTLGGGGAHTFTGDVAVNAGTLYLDNSAAPGAANDHGTAIRGDLTIASGATVELLRVSQIADSSEVNINGGTLNLGTLGDSVAGIHFNNGGAVQSSGGIYGVKDATAVTTAGAGSATISAPVHLINSNPADTNDRIFNIGANAPLTISGVISDGSGGSAGLAKTGAGTLTLSGANTYTGDTTVNAGTLVFDNAGAVPPGDVVLAGGSITGPHGGHNLTANSGSVSIGGAIGSMTVGNTFTLNGATLDIRLDSASADKIIAADAALISGTIRAVPQQVLSPNVSYVIIQTTGGITGDPADLDHLITNNSFLQRFNLAIDGNDLVLTTSLNAQFMDAVGETNPNTNLTSIAAALDEALANGLGGSEMTQALTLNQQQLVQLIEQSQVQSRQAAEQVHLRQRQTLHINKINHVHAVQTAMREVGRQSRDLALADSAPGSAAFADTIARMEANKILSLEPGQFMVTAHSLNDWGDVDGDASASGYEYRAHGVDVGLETLVDSRLLVGGSATMMWTDVAGDSAGGSADVTSLYGSVYLAYIRPRWQVAGGVTYGYGRTDTRRPISGLGLTARGEYDSDIYSGFATGGYTFHVKGFNVEPFGSVDYAHVVDEGYTETEAGGMNMTVDRNGTDSLKTLLALRVSRVYRIGPETRLKAHVSAGWQYEHLDTQVANHVTLMGTTFLNRGVDIDRSVVLLNAGVDLQIDTDKVIYVDYTSHLNADMESHGIEAGLRVLF